MRVKFHREYDHTFPETRAMMNFPAGHEGPVKAEVAEAAIAAGAATEVGASSRAKPATTGARRGRKPKVAAPVDTAPAAPEGPATVATASGATFADAE